MSDTSMSDSEFSSDDGTYTPLIAAAAERFSSSTTSSSGDRRYKCKLCRQSFRRTEHLLRHQLTHSGEKPFQCDVCERGFSRLDALQRHLRIHKSLSTPSSKRTATSKKLRTISTPPSLKPYPAKTTASSSSSSNRVSKPRPIVLTLRKTTKAGSSAARSKQPASRAASPPPSPISPITPSSPTPTMTMPPPSPPRTSATPPPLSPPPLITRTMDPVTSTPASSPVLPPSPSYTSDTSEDMEIPLMTLAMCALEQLRDASSRVGGSDTGKQKVDVRDGEGYHHRYGWGDPSGEERRPSYRRVRIEDLLN